jgi:hypothetical protein
MINCAAPDRACCADGKLSVGVRNSRDAPEAGLFGVCPRCESDRRIRRTRSARSVTSSRLPMGVATTNNVPDIAMDGRLLYH